MNIVITERALLPVRRDKQIGSSFSGGGGGGGSSSMGGGGGITAHSALSQLDYASSGHTGFLASADGIAYDSYRLGGALANTYAPLASPIFTGTVTMPGSGIWNSSGNVGIGTTTPTGGLHVSTANYVNFGNNVAPNPNPDTNQGLFFGWNKTGGEGESIIGYAKQLGSTPRLDFASWDGTTYTTEVTIKGGDVQHPSFSSGWTGSNWQITAAGDATFDNLMVKGSARFRELIIDQLSVIGGSDLLSIARGKIVSVDVANSKVTLEDPNSKGTSAFAVGDFFWIKSIDIDNTAFIDCKGQIPTGGITGVTLTLDFTVTGHTGAITNINVGDVIVQRGHPTTAARQNLIYRTVSDTDNPYERTLTGVNSIAAFTNLANVALQTGNLKSLASYGIVPAIPGVGLYSNNVYLSGKIVASSGSIGGFIITANELYAGSGATRVEMQAAGGFWAGADTFAAAQFSVSPAGVMKALGVVEFGTNAIAGSFDGGNISIKGGMLWENSSASNSGGLFINVHGWHDTDTYYRNLYIYDGKESQIAAFVGTGIGTNGGLLINKNLRVDGTTALNGAATISNTLAVTGAFGCNGSAAQTSYVSALSLSYTSGTYGLNTLTQLNNLMNTVAAIRTALVNNGIMSY